MRFDFHFTSEGWRISEGNTDVPGGFNEASGFTRLLAQHYRGTETCGDPASALAHAILRRVGEGAMIAMVHATGFTDDRQVMAFLGLHFEGCGLRSVLASPDHLRWRERRVFMESQWHSGPVDLAVRFFPAEWLPDLPSRCGWHHLFGNSETPLCNPATALLTQSKRLPLVWDGLDVRLPAWRRLLPETRDIRDIQVDNRRDWVWKPALGRVGDSIGLSGVTSEKDLTWIRHNALRHPRAWIAQRRFEIVPIETADGLLFPCFGVYTIDGRAAGVYGRIGRNRLIDYRAQDIVVLKDLADPINCKPRPQPSFELGASPRAEPYWNTAFRLHHLQTTH
jgi:glutathionylspermidine synthase